MEPIATGLFMLGVVFAALRPDRQAEEDAKNERLIRERYQRVQWINQKEQLALKKKRGAFKMPPVLQNKN
jgi:hypothetical protein